MTGMGAGFIRGNMNFFHYLWYLTWIMLRPEIESGQKGEPSPRRLRSGVHITIKRYFNIKRILFPLRKELLLKRNDEALNCNRGIYSRKKRPMSDIGIENPCRRVHHRHLLFQTFLIEVQKRPCFDFSQ